MQVHQGGVASGEVFARMEKGALGEVSLARGATHPKMASALRVQARDLVQASVRRVADGGLQALLRRCKRCFSPNLQSLKRATTVYDIRQEKSLLGV